MSCDWNWCRGQIRLARERLEASRISDPALTACVAGLARVETALQRPLRIVVVGEYNSGKTSVADLLIGKGMLPHSVVANTGVPVLLKYGSEPALHGMDAGATLVRIDSDDGESLIDLTYRALQLTLPLPWLAPYHVLDTPSAGAPELFLDDADIVLWCTVATRAWTESERNVWCRLPSRHFRNAILVATHKDSIFSDAECAQVLRRLRTLTAGLFKDVVLVSAAPALDGSANSGPDIGTDTDRTVLRTAVESAAQALRNRRASKAVRIVRRLARLAFHNYGRSAVVPEAALVIAQWDDDTNSLIERAATDGIAASGALEDLLYSFARAAECLQPGAIRSAHAPEVRVQREGMAPSAITTLPVTAPFIRLLVADLTGVLRLLAQSSLYEDPAVRKEREMIRATLLALSGLPASLQSLEQVVRAAPRRARVAP